MRLAVIGPLPPPVHGQSAVTYRVAQEVQHHVVDVRIVDTGEGDALGWRRHVTRAVRSLRAWLVVMKSDVVYISVNSGTGMWLTAVAALIARASGARVFLHHHSYAHIRERKLRMVALTRMAGLEACHIVLSEQMASDLAAAMPEIKRAEVVRNAALVNDELVHLPLRADGDRLVLGHLSNLTAAKGIKEVVDLAIELRRAGVPTRLHVAGPILDDDARSQVTRAARWLDADFEYLGPVAGPAKVEFFSRITHFAFPTKYTHEADPLVIYEAQAAGVVCLATGMGSIRAQLRDSPGVVAINAETFVAECLPLLITRGVTATDSHESRLSYLRARRESRSQLAELADSLTSAH